MVRYDMSVSALWTGDQNRAMMITLLGHSMGGTVQARFAGECQLVGRLVAAFWFLSWRILGNE